MNICLTKMTKDLARSYFQRFQLDPALFLDITKYKPYVYNEEQCDAMVERYRLQGRVYFAVMLDGEPIGEVVLKNIDHTGSHCTMGISMRSDEFKNKGYGTQAEILAVRYAFDELGLNTVFADTLIHNDRSQHVLKKVGFTETHRDDAFIYYRCDKDTWKDPLLQKSV